MIEKILFDISYLVVIVVTLTLAIMVLYKDTRDPINLFFGLAILCGLRRLYSIFMVMNSSSPMTGYVPLFWIKAAYFSAVPMPILYLYFARSFSGYLKKFYWLDIVVFIPVPVLSVLLFTDLMVRGAEFLPDLTIKEYFGPLMILYITYFFVYFSAAFWLLANKYFASSGRVKLQTAYIFLGTVIPVGSSGVINIMIPFLGFSLNWQLYKLIPLTTIVLAWSVSAAIVKYKFMEFHYAVTKGILFTVLASFATAAYFSGLFLAARFFQGISGNYSFIAGLVFFFVLAMLFDPLRLKIEKMTDRIFLRTKLDFEAAIGEIASSMKLSVDIHKFLGDSLKIITKKAVLSGAAFLVHDERHERFEVKSAEGCSKELTGYTMTPNYPLIERMKSSGKLVLRRELEKKIGDYYTPSCEKEDIVLVLEDMQKIGAFACIPGLANGRIIVILAVGPKLAGGEFDSEEIDFFITAMNQIAIFVENAALLEKERESARLAAESMEKAKYVEQLERINKDLVKAREDLVKAERISTGTKLSISLQHEINNPLTSVLAITQALLIKLDKEEGFDPLFISQKMKTVEEEALRINQLLERLSGITDPIVREYMPGVEMIDLNAPES